MSNAACIYSFNNSQELCVSWTWGCHSANEDSISKSKGLAGCNVMWGVKCPQGEVYPSLFSSCLLASIQTHVRASSGFWRDLGIGSHVWRNNYLEGALVPCVRGGTNPDHLKWQISCIFYATIIWGCFLLPAAEFNPNTWDTITKSLFWVLCKKQPPPPVP